MLSEDDAVNHSAGELNRRVEELRLKCSRLEERLKNEPYRELFERSADAILIIKNGRFVDCNQATVDMLRLESRDQVLETHPSELSPPTQPDGRPSREKADEMIALAFEKGSHRFEWDHRRADGEVFPVEVLLTAAGDDGTKMLHVVWRDITERRRLEEQLLQAQKMDAIGRLAGGLAHDFNNLLVAIIGHCELLESGLDDRPDLLTHVRQIRRSGTRAAGLVRQLLTFSRKQPIRKRIVDLNVILADLDRLMGRLIGEDIRLTIEPAPETVPVSIDPVQIEQIIVNLINNSRDAMPNGGRITVGVRTTTLKETPAGSPLSITPGNFACLTIRDTGSGMKNEILTKAFEPFFTTKEVGKGTGLGLSTTYGVIRHSNGAIVISSFPDEGTTIEIFLPIASGPTPSHSPSDSSAPRGGDETILVVEDEETVRGLVTSVLENAGYSVLKAQDGLEALRVWELHDGPIDLVLTDVVMPNMGGPELVEALTNSGFAPRVLFMSGYTRVDPKRMERFDDSASLIEKPFSPTRLMERVREILDGRQKRTP